MKSLKRAMAAALAVLLFVMLLPVSPVFAADADMRYGRVKLGEMENGANLQYVYDRLVTGCANAEAEIKIDVSGRNIDLSKDVGVIYQLFYSDYPEYFWLGNAWHAGANYFNGTATLTLTPQYTMPGSTLAAAQSAYNAKVDALTKDLSGSDYDKAKTLHDRLIDTVTYEATSNDQNAYGALVEGKAVCNGYTRAYQHLLLKAGIPAWFVCGTSIDPVTGAPANHAWNLVKLGGQWYYTDVTWDDQGENTFYTYFNITTQQLLEEHTIDPQYAKWVPAATATGANYYIKEGRVFDSYDQAKLVQLLKKDNCKTQIYLTGDMSSFFSSLNANLKSLAQDLGATGRYSISYGYSYLGRGVILEVVIDHTHKAQQTVTQVNASCLAGGTKAYYVCSCGLRFLDQDCTQRITSDSQLEIPAIDHTPSSWKSDAANHWKECTQCAAETPGTRGAHSDGNADRKCDTCTYALPAENEDLPTGGGITGDETNSGGTEDLPPEENTTQGSEPPVTGGDPDNDASTDSTQGADDTQSTDSTEHTDSAQSTDVQDTTPSESTPSATEGTGASGQGDPQGGKAPKDNTMVWILVGGVAALVAAGLLLSVIHLNRKKRK